MPTNSASSSSDASASRRISDVVCRSLRTALAVQCRRHYDTELTMDRPERPSTDQPTRLRIACGDQIQMAVQIRVVPVGGPTYEVHCSVEEGPSRRVTYSRPQRGGVALSRAPCLGRKLGSFLLEALEQQAGRRYLRSQ